MLVDGTSLGLGVLLERVERVQATAVQATRAKAAPKATAATAAKATAAKPKARHKVDVDAGMETVEELGQPGVEIPNW
jgi:hypothetical protein